MRKGRNVMALKKREYPVVTVSRRAEDSIRAGHPWVYDTELRQWDQPPEDGGIVDVVSGKGKFLGSGFYNSHSKIRLRMISRNANDRFDEAFFERRLRYAWAYRKTVMGKDLDCCRLIFGEADTFPGLTVDKFHDILVTQTLSLGIEQRKHLIFPLLLKILAEDGFPVRGIYERNDVKVRELEGLEQGKGYFPLPGVPLPPENRVIITENGIRYAVDYEDGQKTGFFLDQKYNRRAASALAKGRRVLDCFTHTGSFALNAAAAGAETVCAVDISEEAVEMAKENARLNGLEERMTFRCENVFDLLSSMTGKEGFDYIILDPPAFTKSRASVEGAVRGYKEINLRAMKLLPMGGYLATCSCSHFMTQPLFEEMLKSAALDAHVSLRRIEYRQQAPDHPVLYQVPETEYLKFYLFQVV